MRPGAEGGAELGLPCLVLTPPADRAEPTYLVYPVNEMQEGTVVRSLDVRVPAGCVRVQHPSGNPNVFVRLDDPYLSLAVVVQP